MVSTNQQRTKAVWPQVHTAVTASANVGDIFRVPFIPIMRVIDFDCTETQCRFLVKPVTGTAPTEEWVIDIKLTVDAQTLAQQELEDYIEEESKAIAAPPKNNCGQCMWRYSSGHCVGNNYDQYHKYVAIDRPACPYFRELNPDQTQVTEPQPEQQPAATAQPEPDEACDAEVEYAMEIERKLEAYEQKQEEELIEVDSASGVYRVWKGMSLIGIFYRCLKTGLWVAEPRYVGKKRRYKTAEQATDAIVRPYQRRTVDAAQQAIVKAWGMRHERSRQSRQSTAATHRYCQSVA